MHGIDHAAAHAFVRGGRSARRVEACVRP